MCVVAGDVESDGILVADVLGVRLTGLEVLQPGDRLFVVCEGGPSASRLERFPPRLEIEEAGGAYILVDDGPRREWRYVFVPRRCE